jgi:hypothetical protein
VGLGLFNNSIPLLSILDLRPLTDNFILLRSSSTWSSHLNLGLPTGLILYGVYSVIFLVVLVFSILITWAAHLSLCDFTNFIISGFPHSFQVNVAISVLGHCRFFVHFQSFSATVVDSDMSSYKQLILFFHSEPL